ncbi:nucleolar protein 12-domain-containing protein [Cercophora scortea]|uniref:Nucleolar protein 12-domain-containing protein n=1 Tax=Cercophora scortea TaxID=314031 RepID=A0AAE0MCT9_9PEZI|nr:nucleolar protein 12-domain-containing protein [Cercophora scortea]
MDDYRNNPMFVRPRVKKDTLIAPSKKRKIVHKVEEVTFDKDSRSEYLTGFRKRKQARIKHARDFAEQKAHDELIAMRKKIREERKQAVEEHVNTIHQMLREAQQAGMGDTSPDSDDEEWGGIDDPVPEAPLDREEEYIDEDHYTTVTVEAVSVDRDGMYKLGAEPASKDAEAAKAAAEAAKKAAEAEEELSKDKKVWPKKKPKFRYGTKVERRDTERRQKAKGRRRDRD